MEDDFINLPITEVREDELAKIDLDSVDGSSILADGFILDVYPSKTGFDRERIIDVIRPDLTFKDCTMRAMIGLYVLKDVYSTVEVNVYGKRYTFELQKYAVPNKTDFVTVHRTLSKAIAELCGNTEQVWEQLNAILVDIQQDNWKFVE